MQTSDMLILRGDEVSSILRKQEKEIIRLVRAAYVAHAQGSSSLPHSTFLNFPGDTQKRIIALPAYLDADVEVAGVKWVSSFPQNIQYGLDRASAVIVLNSPQTGIPIAVFEGSIISAKRTAASAALAAFSLQEGNTPSSIGFIGCGVINFEIVRFLNIMYPTMEKLVLFDIDAARAHSFKAKCLELHGHLEIAIAQDTNEVLRNCSLVSFATNAGTPYISNLSACPADAVLLHISLRDLAPEVLLQCDNVVDDIEHVLRANTSLHLAQRLVGNSNHIRCNLADILLQKGPQKKSHVPTVFSPFGLGILDMAVSKFVYDVAQEQQQGTVLSSFLPIPWSSGDEHSTH